MSHALAGRLLLLLLLLLQAARAWAVLRAYAEYGYIGRLWQTLRLPATRFCKPADQSSRFPEALEMRDWRVSLGQDTKLVRTVRVPAQLRIGARHLATWGQAPNTSSPWAPLGPWPQCRQPTTAEMSGWLQAVLLFYFFQPDSAP